ncbi:type I pantothenate kinase [Secundilactobacillus kimchicus]|uniref:Pantothenate kinase n=1 Tax=Secundilactobacillus kimchicus JCM 15530 TaxID=1302272 RepID=A0A0R1HTF3_9LACO|nr:type I pantothenate kinase [Secundilactobacillus kimchicus]KRK48825.1 pantothenate kinase [Secundilactobacillus kimchicus JCM 15530]MBT9671966.1 type I pantothenate kinase [Secundilactobacillus kimchicus]
MADFMNYDVYTKAQWRDFYQDASVPLTQSSLRQVQAFNDQISLQDVQDIYIPLIHLLDLEIRQFDQHQNMRAGFLQREPRHVPYIIGIAGSVAVGKSTTARLLEVLMNHFFPTKRVELVTTDGFLYSTDELKHRGLLDRKGFPESYNMKALIKFLNDVKSGKPLLEIPVYSHRVYDIVASEVQQVVKPDVLIVEGINTLQLPSTEQVYVSDFTDFSIYVDANAGLIEKWFLERFHALLELARDDPSNYYYKYAVGDPRVATEAAKRTWRSIDLPNLADYILPTRNRAELIIHKGEHHIVDRLLLRKY